MKLFVVRHGETEANASGVLQGPHIDCQLTDAGVRQIELLVPSIPSTVEIIYCSPLKRVVQSAEILDRDLGVGIVKRDELVERNFGSLAGKTWEELPELKEIDERLQYDYRPYGGESVDNVKCRLSAFLDELNRSQHKEVLTVTSRGPVMVLYDLLEGRIETHVPNGSLHIFTL